MAISDEVNRFWDEWGTLDKLYKPDGGDSCHRVGMYYSLLGMMTPERRKKYPKAGAQSFNALMKKHHVSPGVLIRHPNTAWDASDWDRMSRDQLHPVIMAASYYNSKELSDLTMGHATRLFLFASNTRRNGANKKNHGVMSYGEIRDYDWKIPDPTGPEIWGLYIRAWKLWPLWPMLLFTDLETLIGSIKWRFFPKHNITMNHTLSIFYAADRLPTPISYLSRLIMSPERLINLLAQHFKDTPTDMTFFEEMFKDAWKSIKGDP